jgi:hypothetical protein
MFSRRGIVAGTIAAGALLASPAFACKSPAPKDRGGYTRAIDLLFAAWWARDFAAFQALFEHAERQEPFDIRPLFAAHFVKQERRFRGGLLFNGASVAVQVVTPQGPDSSRAICGGYALADLFLVSFFPNLAAPVVREVKYVDSNVLAEAEWTSLPGARP